MGQDLLLGIDIGTYESKGVLTTPQGKVIAQATIAHNYLQPKAYHQVISKASESAQLAQMFCR
jgi:sugar (pentulose or hexulose) kinase